MRAVVSRTVGDIRVCPCGEWCCEGSLKGDGPGAAATYRARPLGRWLAPRGTSASAREVSGMAKAA